MFSKTYDVVVAGAGVAGVAAALECARSGLKTALVEKTTLVGGLATAGLVNIYLPLCDGLGHQVLFGIAEELLHLSIQYGPGQIPEGWRGDSIKSEPQRYRVVFSPASFVLALDEVLVEAGVDLWLDTLVSEPMLEGKRIVGIEVENKSGRGTLRAGMVIDATGDADIAYRAGAPCEKGGNWLSLWAFQEGIDKARNAAADPEKVSLLNAIRVGGDANGVGHPPGIQKFDGTDGAQVTHFILEGRRLMREHYRAKQSSSASEGGAQSGRSTTFPVTLPSMAQFRTTRRIVGCASLSSGQDGRHDLSSIGLAPDWRKAGPIWEIPYGTLIPQSVTGLLVAGRCISAGGDAWEVMRVIPPAAHTGQVAGIAARLAIAHHTTPDALSPALVQEQLRIKQIPFHINDVLTGTGSFSILGQ